MPYSLATLDHYAKNRTAIVAESSVTFGELRQDSASIVQALTDAGLRRGDFVAIATAHRVNFYRCFAGCFAAGNPVAVLDPLAAIDELVLMLQKAGTSALVADEDLLVQLLERTDTKLPDVVWYVESSRNSSTLARWLPRRRDRRLSRAGWTSLGAILGEKSKPAAAPVDIADDSIAYVMFTSGTTSKPKAVVISRSALRHHVATLARVFGYGENASLLSFFPTHHTDGLVHGVVSSLLTGMQVVCPGKFSASTDLEKLLRANNVSHFLAVPTMLAMIKRTMSDRPKLFDYAGFKSLISTAGYLDEVLWREFQSVFNVRVCNFYGMTETVSGTLYCGPDDDSFQIGTLGKPIDADVRIVNESGELVGAGTIGELQIAGQHLMTGYLDDAEATAHVVSDGWLSTGDLCSRDDNGFFRFSGRKKNIVKRGGITVYPEDVRNAMASMPGIIEVEVIGVPHATFEEVIAACVVVESGTGIEQVRTWCRRKLAPERRPDRIELMDELPRGPSGKVMQDALVARMSEGTRGASKPRAAIRDRVIEAAARTFAVDPSDLSESSSPETIDNWDSYATMEFVLALEQGFGIRLKPHAIMRIRDVGKAVEIVAAEVDSAESSE